MRLKSLLFAFLLWCSVINAQDYIYTDTINFLVITETRLNVPSVSYLEITNMGDKPVQLNQFHIGTWQGNSTLVNGKTKSSDYRIPVDTLLPPGEAYVFAAIKEWDPVQFLLGTAATDEKGAQDNMRELADFHVLMEEGNGDPYVTTPFYMAFNSLWWGRTGYYIEQHFANGDSVVVDQVAGMFTDADGTHANTDRGYDVAGVTGATEVCYLIRRFKVTKGNLNFSHARGVGLDDSEWIPIPWHGTVWRLAPWTIGNHGNYVLDANTLQSDVITVDYANKKLTVPWGIQRGDDIMNYFLQKPGIAWEYIMAHNADSLTHAAQTGDQLRIYVCGNNLEVANFDIVVKEPAADAKMIVPVTNLDPSGNWRGQIDKGQWDWPRVTQNESGKDTIWGVYGGLPYATRVDSLLERLEKPSNAQWEIVYASGIAKPDLVNGDKLKITAQDGSVKEYYISINDYSPSNNSVLSSITWPDIPEFYKGLFGWIGDTIPGFSSNVFNYNLLVPLGVDNIPALIGKTSDLNAKMKVDRASSLSGDAEKRTVNFTVTAEDDTTVSSYNVVLTKEKNPENLQPYKAEPFFSQVINNFWFRNNYFLEICNPGNQQLDLSDYMIVGDNIINPADAIAQTNETNWLLRYEKYIPGYKWANQADWAVNKPYIAFQDISVNSIVQPGDVFVMGALYEDQPNVCKYDYPPLKQLDVQFFNGKTTNCYTWVNQWGEAIEMAGAPMSKSNSSHIYLFRILNDSIKRGLKPATNPNDFKLIDVIGMGSQASWQIPSKYKQTGSMGYIRNPEIYKGSTEAGKSFGVVSPNDVEWTYNDRFTWRDRGYGFPDEFLLQVQDMGKHYCNTPTHYISTVSSLVYKLSEG